MRFYKFTVKVRGAPQAADQLPDRYVSIEQPQASLAGDLSVGDTVHVDADATATTLVFPANTQADAAVGKTTRAGAG